MRSIVKPYTKKRYSTVRWRVILYIAWRSLVTKKLRTLLTITGVIIGVGSIYFLLSFGLGLQNLVTKQIIGTQSVKTIDVTTTNSRIVKLDSANTTRIQKLAHIDRAGLLYSFPGILSKNNSDVDTIAYGVDANYQSLAGLNIIAGRLLKNDDKNAIVINETAAKTIGIDDAKSAVGKTVDLAVPLQNTSTSKDGFDGTYTIVGVISTGAGNEIYIPSYHFDIAGVDTYSQVRLLADNTESIPTLRKSIESMGFQTTSPSDTIDQVNQIFSIFNLLMIGFGSIGMLIAVLGMFNTLTISLLERTKEIGLMISLGGRNKDMSKLFIVESLLLSIVGAVVGIVIAMIFGQIINLIMVNFAHGRGVDNTFQLFANPAWLILAMVCFMAIVGVIVSYFPARRAHSINPIDALRRE